MVLRCLTKQGTIQTAYEDYIFSIRLAERMESVSDDTQCLWGNTNDIAFV